MAPEANYGQATAAEDGAAAAAAPPRSRRWRRRLIVPALVIAALVGLVIGYRHWYESTYFVSTDNAQVTGDLVQVGALNAGRVVSTAVDVGQSVQQGQVIAVVAVPQQVGAVPLGNTPLQGQTGSANAETAVRAPFSGIVAARSANVGATVSAGQPIYSLVDPQRVWVNANVDENEVQRVQPGQTVEVYSDALRQSFTGRVDAVTPASAATFSLLPAQNVSGNFNKVTQWVPVKILVDSGDTVLPLGTSASVQIRVKAGGPFPWPG